MQKKSISTVHALFGNSCLYFIGDCFELIFFLEAADVLPRLFDKADFVREQIAAAFESGLSDAGGPGRRNESGGLAQEDGDRRRGHE